MDNNICAIVEYEYAAKEPDELDLQKGAIIHRIKQMPGGWWQGTLKSSGVTGMFPDNFVRVLESGISSNGNGTTGSGDHLDEGTSVQLRDKSATSNRRCKVIYSYTQVNDDELTLAVGDVIEFLGEVEEGWWRGRLRSKVGVFPSNFVQHIEPSPILASKRPPTIGATVTTSSLTSKAANVAASTTSTTTGGGGGGGGSGGTTGTTSTAKQTTKSRVIAAATSAPAEPAAIASVLGSGATGSGGPAAAGPQIVPMLPPKPQREFCRVEFPYAPQNDDELELRVDDIITVITTELPDKGWWKGEIRGKVGVFPDNFVKMLAPSEVAPINEPSSTAQPQRKISNTASTTSHMTTTNSSNSSTTSVTTQQQKEQIGSTTSKVYIKKTGSSSNSTSSSTTTASSSAGRKESFGSRDSLNDILSETGLPTGNVAAQRKSLENKNLDLTKPPGVGAAVAINQQRSSTSSATTSSATTISTGLTSSSVSKSTESMDEKVKSPPPPVLSKKPSVPLKKTPTGGVPVTAVGNLLSGKKKNPEGKLTTAVSHDLADGLTASKMLSGANQLPESGAPGNLVIRRAATIAVEDTDFDRVERASILTDMRQGRVKAPKRRPPSAAINVLGESNNNSVYVNGSGMGGGSGGAGSASELSEDGGAGGKGTAATASSDDNSTGEEPQLAKPKPREWEKKKAPWMEELKASQVTRKKTPSVEPRGASVAERTSKLFAAEQAISSSSSSTTTKVQSSAVTSSMFVENSTSSSVTTSSTSTTTNDAIMSRSLTAAKATAASSDEETRATRPNSLAIRNQRSVSPLVKSSNASSAQSQEEKPTNQLNNHQDASSSRVNQLEQRVDKLEGLVLNQQRTIEELVNALKSEAERVKILRSELDKYAQCVTQV
ncbi:serine-rich adhesin for platelets isoform X1 [Drosophila rhopaloa]|uniref:SH3 domain-containing protein n=2 Tax=Drosophila rhopaloa TaxID=1041015 RepID=A0ABM5J6C7_DRORH|nr:serine-rich adhesin for platelets isoform X1 [Drosophila rhopaloa]XP_044314378.1 serine-rich adhesin for platelets isoform X1 [Drosophila rhopaloa]XP_044314379.1 serine-rich adhesin for platelets isoform X1 [Drosophila rhopaloa]